ncbi:hypothetical protein EVAR_50356_1 [Eumeta japonica]|uniref:Uncharacterized protein n=1 Tax=Eumeta variegata TaxID=151549 RepID=A0A4C1XW74_EUMVA|nr:hypothetical protein EVAR_50356_1 [Eumeta japonica]
MSRCAIASAASIDIEEWPLLTARETARSGLTLGILTPCGPRQHGAGDTPRPTRVVRVHCALMHPTSPSDCDYRGMRLVTDDRSSVRTAAGAPSTGDGSTPLRPPALSERLAPNKPYRSGAQGTLMSTSESSIEMTDNISDL